MYNGRNVATFEVSGRARSLTWDIKELLEGVYLYSLVTDKKMFSVKRLVILR